MRNQRSSVLTPALFGLALGVLGGCGSEAAPAAPTAPVAPATPVAPVAPPVSPPGMLVPGAPPSTVAVPAAPAVTFTVAAAGEHQIDAMGQPDAQLLLMQGDSLVGQDSDSGDGANARLVLFLAPGTYEARVAEWRGNALQGQVQVQALPLLPPVGAISPNGRPQVVQAPAGDSRRAASAELTLEIRQAGSYRIDVTSAADAGRDAELLIHRDGAVVAEDSDTGEGNNAQITRQLEPGSYRIRARDWVNREAALTVTVTPG